MKSLCSLLIGSPDIPGFSPGTSFEPVAVLSNTSATPIVVTPKVSFTSGGVPQTVSLPTRQVLPQQVDAMNIRAELNQAGISGPFVGAGLTLSYIGGQPGALVAHLTSYDQTLNHVFDVPLKDPSVAMNRFGGSYPWELGGDSRSIIHIRNTGDQISRFTIQLDYNGENYALPMQNLAPQQEAAIDIRQLRDSQTPDGSGRVIPLTVTSGQANWSEHGQQALIGRTEVFSVSAGVASSFSCGEPASCCPPATFSVFCVPGSISGLPGDTGLVQLFELRQRSCDGAQFGPYNVTASSNWSSEDTSVITVGAVDTSGAQCSCVGLGQTNVDAEFDSIDYQFDPSEGGSCSPVVIPIVVSCPVTVFSLRVTLSDTGIHFEDSDSGASIVAGEGFAITVDAVDRNGNPIPISCDPIPISTSTSRALGSGEIGLPANFNLVCGHYQSGGLLLNRVNDTQSGTSYRFSSRGGGFKDFFLYTYFRVTASIEGLVGGRTACGHVIQQNDHFVALPSTGLCGVGVVVGNGTLAATTNIRDVGPWFPNSTPTAGNPCVGPNDPYWNTGGVPRVLSESCDANNAAIDLADGTASDVGITGLGSVVWRFQ